jgi:sugar phosphate isomerase/epimerase
VQGQFSLDKALEEVAKAGIRGCLYGFPGDESRWEVELRTVARSFERAGVALMEHDLPFFLQQPDRQDGRSVAGSVVHALAVAEDTGCLNVVACVGGFGQSILPHPLNWSRASWDAVREVCLMIADGTARRNLRARLLLEMAYTTVIRSPKALADLIDEVGSPNIQGHMDIVNAFSFDVIYDQAGFIRESFDILGDRIHSAHLKDVTPIRSYLPGLEERMVGEGVMDFRTYLGCLTKKPAGFPAMLEHMASMKDIERSFRRMAVIADDMGLPVWDD